MSKKSILITGGAGFIGSNFIPYFLEQNPDVQVVNLDALTYAGSLKKLDEVLTHPRYTFVHGNICDETLVKEVFEEYAIDSVIHFAAESHVDNSIVNPGAFIHTNIQGTFTLLHRAYLHWMKGPNVIRAGFEEARFHHISTDEVYGSLGAEGAFSEETPYAPNSPYSASKASSDFIVRSYFHTYGMNVVTTNCSNNYGPKQHPEKLLPTIIRKAVQGEKIPIYGKGENVRDWLYVLDHCRGIGTVFENGRAGETYNIGGGNEVKNIDICFSICDLLDKAQPRSDGKSYREQIAFVDDRPGHDFRYAINFEKITRDLSWQPQVKFEEGLEKTIGWFLAHGDFPNKVTQKPVTKHAPPPSPL
jgi:dTDP-glucose 4,6-dehydratase